MNSMRRARALVAALSFTFVQAAPAVSFAQAALPAWACAPGETGGSTARGGFADSRGVVREKDTGQDVRDFPASAKGKAPANFTANVPVYFHVITDGGAGDAHESADQQPDRRPERHLRRR